MTTPSSGVAWCRQVLEDRSERGRIAGRADHVQHGASERQCQLAADTGQYLVTATVDLYLVSPEGRSGPACDVAERQLATALSSLESAR